MDVVSAHEHVYKLQMLPVEEENSNIVLSKQNIFGLFGVQDGQNLFWLPWIGYTVDIASAHEHVYKLQMLPVE